MKVYASISGGKDSLAALITHIERGGQCDGYVSAPDLIRVLREEYEIDIIGG